MEVNEGEGTAYSRLLGELPLQSDTAAALSRADAVAQRIAALSTGGSGAAAGGAEQQEQAAVALLPSAAVGVQHLPSTGSSTHATSAQPAAPVPSSPPPPPPQPAAASTPSSLPPSPGLPASAAATCPSNEAFFLRLTLGAGTAPPALLAPTPWSPLKEGLLCSFMDSLPASGLHFSAAFPPLPRRVAQGLTLDSEPTPSALTHAFSTRPPNLTSYLIFLYNSASAAAAAAAPAAAPAPTDAQRSLATALKQAAVQRLASGGLFPGTPPLPPPSAMAQWHEPGCASLPPLEQALHAMAASHPSSHLLFTLLAEAVGLSKSLRLHPPPPLPATSLHSMLAASPALLSDLCTLLGAPLLCAHTLPPISYFLLLALSSGRGAAPGAPGQTCRRTVAGALLHCAASSSAVLATALVNTPAFTGRFSSAELPPYIRAAEAALRASEAAEEARAQAHPQAQAQLQLAQALAGMGGTLHIEAFAERQAQGHPLRLECGTVWGGLLAPSPLPTAPSLLRISTGFSPSSPCLPAFVQALKASSRAGCSPRARDRELQALGGALRERAGAHTRTAVGLVEGFVFASTGAAAAAAAGSSGSQQQQQQLEEDGPPLLTPKDAVLQWAGAVLGANQCRGRQNWEENSACSNGLMLNLAALLCRLCEPITLGVHPASFLLPEAASAAVDKSDRVASISAEYLSAPGIPGGLCVRSGAAQPLISSAHTAATASASAAAASATAPAPPAPSSPSSFVSRVFFLAFEALRLGLLPLLQERTGEQQLLLLCSAASSGVEAGEAAEKAATLRAFTAMCDSVRGDPALLASCLRLCAVGCEYLCRVLGGGGGGAGPVAPPPFPVPPALAACALPAAMLDCIVEVAGAVGAAAAAAAAAEAATAEPGSSSSSTSGAGGGGGGGGSSSSSSSRRSASAAQDPVQLCSSSLRPLTSTTTACAAALPPILHTLLGLLASPQSHYLPTPHTRAALAAALHALFLPPAVHSDHYQVYPALTTTSSSSSHTLHSTPLLTHPTPWTATHALPTLLALYPTLGGGEDALGARGKVAALLGCLFTSPSHAQAALASAEDSRLEGLFFPFANALLSHTSQSLGEAFKLLAGLRQSSGEEAASASGSATLLSPTQAALRSSLRGHLCSLNQGLPLLAALCAQGGAGAEAFLHPVLLSRLGTLVAQCLLVMSTPARAAELKVVGVGGEEGQGQGGISGAAAAAASPLPWHPRAVFLGLLSLALGLYQGKGKVWVRALAAGGAQLFSSGSSSGSGSEGEGEGEEGTASGAWGGVLALATRLGVGAEALRGLAAMGALGAVCAREEAECEAWALEAPPHFLDPLLNTLMEDPVRAGGEGGRVYDRASILQQILSDPRDPYTRQPLSSGQLAPVPELRASIEAWLRGKRGGGGS